MRTIIAGSRSATQADVRRALLDCHWTKKISVVISGTADGADQEGEAWAEENNIPVERYPANWNLYGREAGFIRNRQMANRANALIAIWDGESTGTKNMIALAQARNLKVFIYRFSRVKLMQ